MDQLSRLKVNKTIWDDYMAEKNSETSEEKAGKIAAEVETKKEMSTEELTDLLQRTQANFENYRKQTQAYVEEIKKMAARDIVLQVLPILDNFELALKAVPQDQANIPFVQGITLIHSQLLQLLQHNNVVSIETAGKDFDPYYHEALMKVPSELPANKIMEEFQKGFIMHGKVLRHAKVKVSAGNSKLYTVSEFKNNANISGQKQNKFFEAGTSFDANAGHPENPVHKDNGAGGQPPV